MDSNLIQYAHTILLTSILLIGLISTSLMLAVDAHKHMMQREKAWAYINIATLIIFLLTVGIFLKDILSIIKPLATLTH